MRIQQQVLDEPHGNAVPNLGIRVRRKRDGVTLATVTTDANGIALIAGDGHYPSFYLETTNQIGGARLWRSDDTIAAGAFSPAEVPYALRAFGDGYIAGYLNNLAVSLNGATLSLGTGGALVAGYPVINSTADSFPLARPSTGTRVDRLVARVYGDAHEDHGLAEFAILAGTVDAGAPALTQTSSVYEVALATVSVPSAGSLAMTDERTPVLGRVTSRAAPVTGVARASSVATSSTGGEAVLSLDLELPQTTTYDIEAEFTGYQASTSEQAILWESSYGSHGASTGQFSSPFDLAFSPDGTKVYVADYSNNRVVYLTYAGGVLTWVGTISVTKAIGVCTDGSGNVYVLRRSDGRVERWDSTLSTRAYTSSASTGTTSYGIATDSTSLFVTDNAGSVYRQLCVSGTVVDSASGWGPVQGVDVLSGSLYITRSDGNVYRGSASTLSPTVAGGALSIATLSDAAYGITTEGTDLYVSALDNQVRKMSTSGTVLATFGTYGSGDGQLNSPRGITIDPAGDIWIADAGNHRLQRFGLGSVVGGYGDVAVAIDGNVSTYVGRGTSTGSIGNAHTRSVSGPATVTVAGYGKATADTLSLTSCVLSATARPRL